jgi:NAD(P)-dependent dehydrogenase (short-subunit alcohol dehydrogenase family)
MSNEALGINTLFTVKGKVAVVTGGSRGIGLMIAQGYVQNAAKVYISSRKAEVCDAVAEELSKVGECISIPADLSNKEGWESLVEGIKANEDSVDILVNNAGATWGEPFDEFSEDGFDRTLDINLKGIFFLTQLMLPLLEKNHTPADPARVINIGSIDGIKVPSMDNFPYGPSKAAVHHLTKVLAVRLAPRGVSVNAIAPGPFESKMMEWTLENFKDHIEANCPLGRIGATEDMAALALFLASPGASYLNGTIIPLDGGICIK